MTKWDGDGMLVYLYLSQLPTISYRLVFNRASENEFLGFILTSILLLFLFMHLNNDIFITRLSAYVQVLFGV